MASADQQPDWAALPLELLERCLATLKDLQHKRAAFRTCTAFARALLLSKSSPRLRWDVERAGPFAASAKMLERLLLQEVAGTSQQQQEQQQQQQQQQQGVTLVMISTANGSPGRCLAQLRTPAQVRLTCVSRLELQGLSLDALIPDGLDALLPNLRTLSVKRCRLTAAAAEALVNACSSLQHLEVKGLAGEFASKIAQLQQLAGLPSLASVSLLDSTCPTRFLTAIRSQLTLHLDTSYRQVQPGTQTPTAQWRARLQHVARCTHLQSLTIPCATSEELGIIRPALERLQRLHLNSGAAEADGDAVVELLLGLTHLASLQWVNGYGHTFQRSHASSPCRWKELSFKFAAARQLASLPLHSLTSPVTCEALVVNERASVAEMQAAAANVTSNCKAGLGWRSRAPYWPTLHFHPTPDSPTFTRGEGEADTPAALLRALTPLRTESQLCQLVVPYLDWDAELVKVLGQVLPRSCVELGIAHGRLTLPACVQLAQSLPWLQRLQFQTVCIAPAHSTTAMLTAAKVLADSAQLARPALRALHVRQPVRPAGVSEEVHRAAWEEARAGALSLGLGVTFSLAL